MQIQTGINPTGQLQVLHYKLRLKVQVISS